MLIHDNQKFNRIVKSMGLTPEQAVNLFIKQVTIRGKIPFELQGQLKEEQFKLYDGIDLDRYQIVRILINGHAFDVKNWYEAYDTVCLYLSHYHTGLWHEWDKRHHDLSRFELSDDDYLKLLRELAEFCIMNDDFVVCMIEK